MSDQLHNLLAAGLAFVLYCLREPWAAVASATFVAGLLITPNRSFPLVQLGKVLVGSALTWGIIRLLQEVLQ